MKDAAASQEQARPPQPQPDWKWSDRLGKWISPRASPFSGLEPPVATRFKTGDPSNGPRGQQGGIISGRVRELMRNDDRLIEKIANRWLRDAARGDNRAREQLLDRLEGKVEQAIRAEITSRYVIEEIGIERVLTVQPGAPALPPCQPDASPQTPATE